MPYVSMRLQVITKSIFFQNFEAIKSDNTGYSIQHVPPKKLSFRFRISLSDMTNYKSADF